MKYENFAVPFQTIGNRQVIIDTQIHEMPWLAKFIESFPRCFERNDTLMLFIFYPEGDAPE